MSDCGRKVEKVEKAASKKMSKVLLQSARMLDHLMSISRADTPMFVSQMRPETVDSCVGLEPLTNDVENAPYPISCCWWDRD